jgi:hypothetical protein
MAAVPVRADRVDGVPRTGRRTARVRDWTSSDGEWAAFAQVTGTAEAPALELWPGLDGRG